MCGSVACGSRGDFEKPQPPDMSALVADYTTATGVLDSTSAALVVDAYADRAARVDALGIQDLVLPALQTALEAEEPQSGTKQLGGALGQRRQALSLDADGTLRVTRICNGWEPEPVADKGKNGSLVLVANFSEDGLDPVVWGDANACLYLVGGAARVVLDRGVERRGSVRVHLGKSTAPADVGKAPLLFDIALTASVDDAAVDASLDFRVDPDQGSVETRVATPDGHVLAQAGVSNGLTVRASNGTFECDLPQAKCISGSGQVVVY